MGRRSNVPERVAGWVQLELPMWPDRGPAKHGCSSRALPVLSGTDARLPERGLLSCQARRAWAQRRDGPQPRAPRRASTGSMR